jgi:hypothetical protein
MVPWCTNVKIRPVDRHHRPCDLWSGDEVVATGTDRTDGSKYTVAIGGTNTNDRVALVPGLGTGPVFYLVERADQSIVAVANDSGLVEGYSYSAFGSTTRRLAPTTCARASMARRGGDSFRPIRSGSQPDRTSSRSRVATHSASQIHSAWIQEVETPVLGTHPRRPLFFSRADTTPYRRRQGYPTQRR